MKRFFSVFLCLTVWLSAFAYDFWVDGIRYNIIGDDQVEVAQGYGSYSGSVVIPSSVTYTNHYDGLTHTYSVTTIGHDAFDDCSSLISLTIPNSVTSIGNGAFIGCTGLTSVTIPASVTTIEYNAFGGCSNLTSVKIGSGMTYLGPKVFTKCPALTNITCYATMPPTIQSNTFDNYDATLYVPASSIPLYQSAEYWKNFYIQPLSEEPTQLEYSLADRNVVYCNNIVYNEDCLGIKLFDASGRIISSGNGDIEMSDYPNGIYIVTDGKGGFLKINHYR